MNTEKYKSEFNEILAAISRRGGEATATSIKRSISKYNEAGGMDILQGFLADMVSQQILSVRTVKAGNGKPVDIYYPCNGNTESNSNGSNDGNRSNGNTCSHNKSNARNGNRDNRSNGVYHVKLDTNESIIRIMIPGKPEIHIEGWREFIGLLAPVISIINSDTESSTDTVNTERSTTDATDVPVPPAPFALDDDEPFDPPSPLDEDGFPSGFEDRESESDEDYQRFYDDWIDAPPWESEASQTVPGDDEPFELPSFLNEPFSLGAVKLSAAPPHSNGNDRAL